MSTIIPNISLDNPGPAPLDAAASSGGASGSGNTPNNQLDGNSFITLLTAQLQAQDPLNPLDPNQMVSELTQMNTLQQIIQIREDMDAMLQNSQAAPTVAKASAANEAAALGLAGRSTFAMPRL